jgi:hypothetical protein
VVDPDTAIRMIRNLADTVPITHFYPHSPDGLAFLSAQERILI